MLSLKTIAAVHQKVQQRCSRWVFTSWYRSCCTFILSKPRWCMDKKNKVLVLKSCTALLFSLFSGNQPSDAAGSLHSCLLCILPVSTYTALTSLLPLTQGHDATINLKEKKKGQQKCLCSQICLFCATWKCSTPYSKKNILALILCVIINIS